MPGVTRNGGGSSTVTPQLVSGLTAAGTFSASDKFPVSQDGGNSLVSMSGSAITDAAQKVKTATIAIASNVTLDSTAHHRKLLVCTSAITVSLPSPWPASFANLGDGFECRILNVSGGAITLDSNILTNSGTASLTNNKIASIVASSAGNIVFASIAGVSAASGTITLTTPSAQYWSQGFAISGTFTGTAPSNVDVQVDGAGSWTTLTGFSVTGSAWTGTVPGTLITSGSSHTLTVRETNNTTIVSSASGSIAFSAAPAFAVTAVTPAAVGVVGSNQTFNITYSGTLGTITATVDGTTVAVSNATGSGGSGSFTIVGPALDATNGPYHTLTAAGASGSAQSTYFATAAGSFPAPFNFMGYDFSDAPYTHPYGPGGSYGFFGTSTANPTGNGTIVLGGVTAPPAGFTEYTLPQTGRSGSFGMSLSNVVPPPLPLENGSTTYDLNARPWGPAYTNSGYHSYGMGMNYLPGAGTYYLWIVTGDGHVLVSPAKTVN